MNYLQKSIITGSSDLVLKKKMITTQKLVKLEIKYIIIIILHKLLLNNFTMRLNQANLTSQNDIANFVNKQILIINSKIALYIV